MSISANVGSLATYLSKIRSRQAYFRFKDGLTRVTLATPLIGKTFYRFFQKIKQALKSMFYQGNVFENMGFAYLGPVDGHNQRVLERVLERAKNLKKPCLVHVKTIKGKGYSFAENQPTDFHGLSSFDIETGVQGKKVKPDFSDIFGEVICALAKEDPRICAITAAMAPGCGLTSFSRDYADRFFDVGIAEQHALTFAGGLAKNGMKPVFAVYSSFLQRGFDQVVHDLALQNVDATICVDRAGIVGEDGETHQGLFDIPMLLSVPGISIYSPTCYADLKTVLPDCINNIRGVKVVRYPRGYEPDMILPFRNHEADVEWIGSSDELCVVSYGRQVVNCLKGIRKANLQVSFLKLNRIYPISDETLKKLLNYKRILFIEECYQNSGIGSYLGNLLLNLDYKGKYRNFGIKSGYLKSGKTDDLLCECHLDGDSVAEMIRRFEAVKS